MGIDFPIPRKTPIIKFASPGTAKVPSAQELNDEASNWDIWPINWIILNVSKSPNTKVWPFVLRYENVSCTIHNMYTITLGCAASNLFKTEWYTSSMQCPTYQEENQLSPNSRTFFLRRKFNDQHVTVRSCPLPRQSRWKRRDGMAWKHLVLHFWHLYTIFACLHPHVIVVISKNKIK